MASLQRYTVHEAANIQLGTLGTTFINTTTPYTGSWALIRCITEAAFDLLTDADTSGDALTDGVFPAGTILYGKFTAITLASGAVLAHKSPEGVA